MLIRPSTPDDYPALADLTTQTSRNYVVTAEQLAYADANRDPKIKAGRWIAERDGQMLGFAMHTQPIDLYDPDKLWVRVRVYPEYRRQGIGTQLYNHLLANVQHYNPLSLLINIDEDETESLQFAIRRGFAEIARRWESCLQVAGFDLAPYGDVETRLAAQGIVIKSLAELADDPDRDRKFYELQIVCEQDVPIGEPYTPPTFEQFRKMYFENPSFSIPGTFVAIHDTRYVGLSSMAEPAPKMLDIDLTATHPEYRRRGIALAVKIRGIHFAQAHGYQQINVMNDPVNVGMLAINEQLGFVRQPAQIKLEKTLR